jgi:hypothetical protein
MALIRKKWTPAEADEWGREDLFAIILSPIAYIGLALGVAMSLLLLTSGFIILLASVAVIIIMHLIIDPKLKTISKEYERKQKTYLEELERIERWEERS